MLVGPGERSFAVAEEFAFHEVFRQGAAIHRHQRRGSPAALFVDRPGHEFLAGAGFAMDQHRGRAPGHAGDESPYPLQCGRRAHEVRHPLGPADTAFEGPQAGGEFPFLSHPLQHGLDVGEFARLRQVVEHSLPNGGDRALHRRLAGDDHGLTVGRGLPQPGDDVQAARPRHVEVDDHAVVGGAIERRDRRPTIGADGRLVPQSR